MQRLNSRKDSLLTEPGAGPLLDVTVYALQLAISVLGPVRRVTALANRGAPERTWKGTTIAVEVDDNNLLLMEFESGALAVAAGSNCRGSARIPWGGPGDQPVPAAFNSRPVALSLLKP